MRLSLAILFLSIPCLSQPLTIGVKGAIRTTTDLEGEGVSESRLYLIGPMVEVALPHHFAFEVDALYSRFGYTSTTADNFGDFNTDRIRANSWEFPLLAKYRFAGPRLHPFVSLGYAPRHMSGTFESSGYTTGFTTGLRSPYSFTRPASYHTGHAGAIGGGVAFDVGHIRIEPEVRYLRWKDPLDSFYGSHGYYLLVPQNEVQVLLGIGWGR